MELLDVAILVVGFLTATLSGVAGVGGGTILIGVFYALGMAPAEAVPLLAAVQFVANSSRTVAYVRHVEWRAAGWFMLAAVPATFLAVPFVAQINEDMVKLLMAGLMLASLAPGQADKAPLPPRPSFVLAGFLNGALGPFVGATGLFVGRLFLRPEWRKETTIGTLALTQLLGHGMRVIAFGFVGLNALAKPLLLGALCIVVIGGTALGKHLNSRVSEAQFTRLFQWILVLLSLKIAYDGVRGLWWS